jgi:hypothetical protein
MNVSNSIKYTSNFIKNNYITSNTSQKEKNHQANVEVSKQDIFTSTRSNGEQVTYNLKLLRSQKSFNDADTVKLDMSDRDNISTMQNKQFININWETNEHKYGHLIGKEKIDEFISMTERLDPEQLDKMQYLAPSQDWMNLADKVVDEQLNSLVDLAFDISEFVFFEAYSSENVDSIIQELNTLDSNELNGAINTMLHLNEQAKNSNNNGSMPFSHKEGEILRDYMEMISSPHLKEKEISVINEHLVNMNYTEASGLMESVKLMEGSAKDQLFNLLQKKETDEIAEIFSYIGELSTKPSNYQNYQIEFGNGRKELTTVFDPNFSDSKLSNLIKNVLSVENKTDLNTVIGYINKSSNTTYQAQVPIWEEIAKSINESPKMLDDSYFDNLIDNVTAEIDDRHEKQIRSKYKPLFEKLGNENLKVMWHSELIN